MNESSQHVAPPPATNSRIYRGLIWVGKLLVAVVMIVALAWTSLGVLFLDHWLPPVGTRVALGGFLVLIGLGLFRQSWRRLASIVFATSFLCVAVFYATRQPSHDREWQPAQSILPQARFTGSLVEIDGLRVMSHDAEGNAFPEFTSYTVDSSRLASLWFGVDRFDVSPALAHTFVSFGFETPGPRGIEQTFLTVSIETRREAREETYSPLRGLFNHYELMYVVAREEDMLSFWTHASTHPIQLYPVQAEPELIRRLFTNMMHRVNQIHDRPEFYHTLKSNCNNDIVYHVNRVSTEPINVFARGVVFPGYSDWLAYRYGLIDTELTLDEAREEFRIDEKARQFDGQPDFSQRIRE